MEKINPRVYLPLGAFILLISIFLIYTTRPSLHSEKIIPLATEAVIITILAILAFSMYYSKKWKK